MDRWIHHRLIGSVLFVAIFAAYSVAAIGAPDTAEPFGVGLLIAVVIFSVACRIPYRRGRR